MAVAQPHHTLTEILSQPQTWQAVLSQLPAQAQAVAQAWPAADRAEALFSGCGSPYYLARTAAAVCQSLTGLPSRADPASDRLFYPAMLAGHSRRPLLVAFSRSGETTEIVQAVAQFRARYPEGLAAGIICRPGTALERQVQTPLLVPESDEISLAETRTFTGMLVTAQLLIAALAGRELRPAFRDLPAHGQAVLEPAQPLARALGENLALERLFFLGSGPLYGLACEAMLKMKEMSLSYSEAYHFLEFRHGPMAMAGPNALVVGLVSEAALPHEVAVLTQMRALGATVLAITPTRLAAGLVDHQLVLPAGLTDWERAPLYLPGPQLLAYYRAVAKGLHPDHPHNLSAFVSLDLAEIEARAVRGAV